MISISLERKPSYICLRFSGHAGYAPYGSDIVCAAVSTLYYTLYNGLKKQGAFVYESCEGNDRMLSVILLQDNINIINVLVESFADGLSLIAKEYPEHVCVIPAI